MIMKDMFHASGLDIEVHNLFTDYTLKDGSRAHVASQVSASGTFCTDKVPR